MWNNSTNTELRKNLREITENTENHGVNVARQLKLIKDLSVYFPHAIELIEEAKMGDDNSWRYNCFMYAFDLRNKFIDFKYTIRDIFPNSKFTRYLLINNFLLEINLQDTKNGDYILYFEGTQIKHAGKVNDCKIISKWGSGHRWSHALFEVPSDYGDETKFFRKISEDDIYSIFKQWSENQLITNQSSER